MSLQALMAVHVTPEMTLRYAALASPTLRTAYDQAIGKVRKTLPIAPAGQPIVPAKVDWIASEFLKTRVPMATAPGTLPPAPAPTPTSAKPATTSSPHPNTYLSCATSSPTSASSAPTPSNAAGLTRSSDTTASSTLWNTTAAASKTRPLLRDHLDRITIAG